MDCSCHFPSHSIMRIITFLLVLLSGKTFGLWNNLNCPAPRSPENGLNFIFRNGELVHFRCHPGYVMRGKAVAYCVNNQWTAPAPLCLRVRKDSDHEATLGAHDDSHYYRHQGAYTELNKQQSNTEEKNKKLFDWDNKSRKQSVYGDGPRRVPLINGIWPEQDVKLMVLGPQSTPAPMDLVREEVNIAELRHKQYEEVKKQRHADPNLDLLPSKPRKRKGGKRRKKHKNSVISDSVEDDPSRRTIISLGSTEDGDALSIAHARPANDTNEISNTIHRYRHRDPKKKRRGKGKKKWGNQYPYSENVIARASRVDNSGISPYSAHRYRNRLSYGSNEVAEFRRLPVEQVHKEKRVQSDLAEYDTSCVESFYGRDVPMIAPQVANAFVYRYETKKNKEFPFNSYMQVRYRCLTGYTFADVRVQSLKCREASWVGEVPRCVDQRG